MVVLLDGGRCCSVSSSVRVPASPKRDYAGVHATERRGRALLSVVRDRHGGGSSAGLALLPSLLLDFWGDTGRTHLLHQVHITRARSAAGTRRSGGRCPPSTRPLSPSCVFFTNSEDAKSTSWLHPVTGEAVVTGHRSTPGKTVWVFFPLVRNQRALAQRSLCGREPPPPQLTPARRGTPPPPGHSSTNLLSSVTDAPRRII